MNDVSLAKRILHHLNDEEILRKLYQDPLCRTDVKQVIVSRVCEIATKRFGLSHSYVGHRVRVSEGRYVFDDVVVGFSAWVSDIEHKTVMGVDIEIRNYRYVNKEAENVEALRKKTSDDLTDAETDMLRTCIRKYSTRLWRRHSNLNIISACSIKSKNGGAVMKRRPCIVLYCSVKGIIPISEKPFPKVLRTSDGADIPVDVREGYFQFAGSTTTSRSSGERVEESETLEEEETIPEPTYPVYIGQGFKTKPLSKEGTIGPFVEISDDKTGFITCAHSVFDCARQTSFQYPTRGVLTNDVTVCVQDENSEGVTEKQVQCQVIKAVFTTRTEERTKRDINLDAALVELPECLRGDCEVNLLYDSQVEQCGEC